MGTPDFAVPSIELLCRKGFPVLAVVTGQDKPRGRGRAVSPTPVGLFAQEKNLPLLKPPSLSDPAFLDQLARFQADIFVVVAFRILPREVFRLSRLASFNLHASLLPKYRGAAPINWAIMKGETLTGVTTFVLADKVDTGGILLQESVPIHPGDTAGSLHDRLSIEGSRLVLETVRLIEGGEYKSIPQDDSKATPAPKIRKEECRIDWKKPAIEIHNKIRGLCPNPAAWTVQDGRVLKIYSSTLSELTSLPPGHVKVAGKGLSVGTADRALAILEIQQEGKKRMRIEEFLRGYEISTGGMLD